VKEMKIVGPRMACQPVAGRPTIALDPAGCDSTTDGVRNIQLVTPALTHWIGGDYHTGHIAILKMEFVPEPHAVLLLAAGVGALVVLRRGSRKG